MLVWFFLKKKKRKKKKAMSHLRIKTRFFFKHFMNYSIICFYSRSVFLNLTLMMWDSSALRGAGLSSLGSGSTSGLHSPAASSASSHSPHLHCCRLWLWASKTKPSHQFLLLLSPELPGPACLASGLLRAWTLPPEHSKLRGQQMAGIQWWNRNWGVRDWADQLSSGQQMIRRWAGFSERRECILRPGVTGAEWNTACCLQTWLARPVSLCLRPAALGQVDDSSWGNWSQSSCTTHPPVSGNGDGGRLEQLLSFI